MKKNRGMNWIGYAICVVVLILSMFAGLDMFKVFNARSNSTGSITETKYFETVTDFEFAGSQIQFVQEQNKFSFSTNLKPINNFDGVNKDYELLINNQPCATNTVSAGEIESIFILYFYDSNGAIAANPTLTIQIKFYSTRTALNLFSLSSANDVSYLQSYIANDGFNMQLVYSKR